MHWLRVASNAAQNATVCGDLLGERAGEALASPVRDRNARPPNPGSQQARHSLSCGHLEAQSAAPEINVVQYTG